MEEIKGFFAILIERPRYDPRVVGMGKYEQALDTYHEHVAYYAKYNPEYSVRLIKITFLD